MPGARHPQTRHHHAGQLRLGPLNAAGGAWLQRSWFCHCYCHALVAVAGGWRSGSALPMGGEAYDLRTQVADNCAKLRQFAHSGVHMHACALHFTICGNTNMLCMFWGTHVCMCPLKTLHTATFFMRACKHGGTYMLHLAPTPGTPGHEVGQGRRRCAGRTPWWPRTDVSPLLAQPQSPGGKLRCSRQLQQVYMWESNVVDLHGAQIHVCQLHARHACAPIRGGRESASGATAGACRSCTSFLLIRQV